MPILQYSNWQNFEKIIDKAKISYQNSDISVLDHFTDVNKMVQIGSGAYREQIDYKLTRYACYLIAQNGDSRKKVIALAQTYFAVQTRKQEITEKEYSSLTEDEKRFYQRNLTKKGNYSLNQTAKNAGVRVCGVLWGFRTKSVLAQYQPDFLTENPAEILNMLA